MRVGVIGTGFGGKVVAPAFEGVAGCEVVDVVSPRDGDAVAALCARADVDLVSVHSPPFLHLDHVRRAVEAGHDVLCDKPFGRDAGEAAEMRDLAAAAGVLHFLNFENRFDPARACVRAAVADGVAGEPSHVAFSMLMGVTRTPLRPYGWLFDAGSGGGWLRAMGSHMIDFTRWAFGEVVDVGGTLRTAVAERPDAGGTLRRCTADDGFSLVLRSDRGVTVAMDSSSVAPLTLTRSMVVVGTDGALVEDGGRVVLRTPDGDRVLHEPDGGNPLVAAMGRYAEVVRDAVADRQAPPDAPTFDDGLACAVVMDRAGRFGTRP